MDIFRVFIEIYMPLNISDLWWYKIQHMYNSQIVKTRASERKDKILYLIKILQHFCRSFRQEVSKHLFHRGQHVVVYHQTLPVGCENQTTNILLVHKNNLTHTTNQRVIKHREYFCDWIEIQILLIFLNIKQIFWSLFYVFKFFIEIWNE